jgi:Cu/Ag efflux pump CusA
VWAYVIGAAIVIFFLLQAGFASWRLASLQFLLLPAALAGGLVVAAVDRAAVSAIALAGLLTVLAMAIRGGLLQIKQYQRLEDEGKPLGPELVELGSRQRLVPTITSYLAAGLALIPLVVYGSVSGLEIVSPLALIIVGGLVTTAFVNLLVLPALYLRIAARARPDVAGPAGAEQPQFTSSAPA